MHSDTEFVTVGTHKARALDVGEGPAVVVLHGWGGRIESMAPVISCLRARFRVLALDLPGFGRSPHPEGVWGTEDYAAFVRDVLLEKKIPSAKFVGHSFGAKTSLCIAAVYPDLVDKMVLVGSSGLRIPPSLEVRVKRGVSRVARVAGRAGPPGKALRALVYRLIASKDYQQAGALRPILVRVVNEDFTELLPLVKASTLLVWGSEDDAVPLSHARTMEKLIPDAGLVLFEGAGHFAYLDERERFCRVVRHFFGAPLDG